MYFILLLKACIAISLGHIYKKEESLFVCLTRVSRYSLFAGQPETLSID